VVGQHQPDIRPLLMNSDQLIISVILIATIAMFLHGSWRHDMVAIGSLLACVITGLLPAGEAFAGFGHPAVVTVACVLVMSRGLQASGAVDALVRRVLPGSAGPVATIAALTGLGTVLSAFMNNVGALALLMPVAIQAAAKQKIPPGRMLMPLAFGSILGGMTTLIGTPPNLIVSAYRAKTGTTGFGMFDFTPVGLAVAAAGVVFLVFLGWRLVPVREPAGAEGFDIGAYLTEVRVAPASKAAGGTLRDIGAGLEAADAQVIGLVRNGYRVSAPGPEQVLRVGDILVIEAEPESLASALSALGLTLEEADHDAPAKPDGGDPRKSGPDEISLIELAVRPDASLIGRTARDLRLRTRHGINLLGISRQGRRSIRRLRSTAIKPGDVLLLQGGSESVMGFASEFGCVPLAPRALRIPDKRRAITVSLIMLAAVMGAAFGLLPAAISFAAGVLACMALRVIPLRAVYESIDWPVVVLLGAMIPVAGVMATTGAADLIARLLLEHLAQGRAAISLVVILIVTMTLSDFMNNAATAAVMCPIAISTAVQLDARPDSFLMAVAIGASCAFLTPIGHQNNTLILGPGGFRFGDYWRVGLPLEILVLAVGVPMLLLFWPL
jgi:di/tricarboxylate transporter